MKFRTTALLCAPISIIFVGAVLSARGDVLNDRMRQFAGANAIDCGVGRSKTIENNLLSSSVKRAAQDACATKAFRAKKPYFARYDEVGGGATVTLASALNERGEVKFWNYQTGEETLNWKDLLLHRGYWLASGICSNPVIHHNAVGCGTTQCVSFGQVENAGCVIFTKSRDRLSPSQ